MMYELQFPELPSQYIDIEYMGKYMGKSRHKFTKKVETYEECVKHSKEMYCNI